MTKEEAIQFLDNMKHEEAGRAIGKDGFYAELMGYHVEALNIAIKALKQEPCEDAISREQAIKQCGFGMTSLLIADNLRRLPPVNPQPKTGHWIFDEILDKHYYCSECKSMGVDYWDYCPNCGAKMQEVESES